MKRTKEQVKEDLNLAELPDDEFMALLEEVEGLTPYSTKRYPPESKSWTPDEIREVLTKESGIDFRKTAIKK
jgi:hypothetical protein